MAVDGYLNFDTSIDTKGFNKGTKSITNSLGNLKSALGKVASAIAVAFSVQKLIEFGKQAVETASDLAEAQNVVDVSFGEMSDKMENFADTCIETYGISKLTAKQTGSTFAAMGSGMGLALDNATDMAVALTGLSADMASFYNVSQDTASTALKSIFTGETETLKQFGIVMTQTNLEAYALSQGITKSYEAMSEAEKVQLRYGFVMQSTALAQGDFARTSDGWANQTRMLSEKWKEFSSVMGNVLMNVLLPAVRMLNNAMSSLISVAQSAANALSEIFGFEIDTANSAQSIADSTSAAADNYSDMANSAEETQEANENSLASFDKINKLNDTDSSSSSSAGSSAITAGQGSISINAEVDTSEAESSLSEFFSNLKNYFNTNFKDVFNGLKSEFSELGEIFSDIFSDIKSLSKPIKKYLLGDFTTYLKKVFTVSGTILTGLLDTFNMVFSDIWNLAVFPMLKNFLSVGLPVLTQFQTQVWGTLGVLFTNVKSIFDRLWQDAVSPVLGFISQLWCDTWQTISDFWSKWGQPIFDGINTAITTTKNLFLNIWESVLQPIFEKSMETLDKIWAEHLQPLIAEFLDFVGELITGATDIYNQFIAPIVNWLVNTLGPVVTRIVNNIQDTIGVVIGNIIDTVKGLITVLKGVIQFISGVLTGDWKKAWLGIKTIFKGVWSSFTSIVKTPINLIIGMINKMTGAIESAINGIINAINTLSWDIPEWVPGIGGETFGFNLGNINIPEIPHLATGAVIPPNSEFLAVLGDQKRGTNIEAPLDTIKQAVAEVLAAKGSGGMSGPLTIPIYLNTRRGLRLLSTEIIDDINDIISSTGNIPIDL